MGVDLAYAERHPNILVIVTADHETGEYGLNDGSISEKRIAKQGFTTDYHTGSMVPIFAKGPMAHRFAGFQDNTDVGKKPIDLIIE